MQNPAFLDMSRLDEMEHAADELRDMRLDIDGMSYEVNFFFIYSFAFSWVYAISQWNG